MGRDSLLRLFILALAAALIASAGCDELITEVNNTTIYSDTIGVECFDCHGDEDDSLLLPARGQWANSRHASGDLIEAAVTIGGTVYWTNQCGPVCHTNEGFVAYTKDTSDTGPVSMPSAIGCFTCHLPHTGAFKEWRMDTLRYYDSLQDYRLNSGQFYVDREKGRKPGRSSMCIACHQASGAPPEKDNWSDITLTATWGPHYSPQADVVSGTGGYWFGDVGDTIFHGGNLFADSTGSNHGCLICHYGTGIGYEYGEHTFRLENDGTGEQYTTNCSFSSCHNEGITDFYDSELLATLALTLAKPLADSLIGRGYLDPDYESIPVGATIPARGAQILYNYLLYRHDGSDGVHNPVFLTELLANSQARWDSLPPVPEFSVSDSIICVGTPITFTNATQGMPESYEWDFGDGVSADTDPVHTYNSAGNYTVTLTAISAAGADAGGAATIQKTDLVTVVGPPEVDFTLDTTQGTCQLEVTFTDQTNFGDPAASDTATWTWDWTFHDGSPDSTASGAVVTHTFNHPGSGGDEQFNVTLEVTSACGTTALTKDTVVTVAPCAR